MACTCAHTGRQRWKVLRLLSNPKHRPARRSGRITIISSATARANYGGEAYSSGTLALRDVNSPPYVATIGLSGSETANYEDTRVIPSGGAQTAVSIQRAYVARETLSLKNGKVFETACHYHTTETFSNPALTSTTVADAWLAPGAGLVKSVANVGGTRINTRELESATVAGQSY